MRRLAILLLLLAPFAPGEDDRPVRRADANLQPRINTAIQNGIAWLKSAQRTEGCWFYRFEEENETTAGMTALALYALAASKVPSDDETIRKGVRWTEQKKASYSSGTYSNYAASLLILALTRIDAERHRARIHRLAGSLVESQLANDLWTYEIAAGGTKGKERELEKPPQQQLGDNSNSQFAVLALWAASALAGYDVPERTWRRVQALYQRSQLPSGAWGYFPGRSGPSATMTSAGLCSYVYATAGLLGGVTALPLARGDPIAKKGVAALLDNIESQNYSNYYLVYALERAGTVMAIPEDRWYVGGARALVAQQDKGGRWDGGAYETSLALLFLSQATRAAITHGGDPNGARRITEFPRRVGPGQLEDAFLYYLAAKPAERKNLQVRFAEAQREAVGFLVGKLRSSARDARVAACELLDRLVEKRFLFDPDATEDERDVMLAPIEAYWKEHGKKLLWDDTRNRFVAE